MTKQQTIHYIKPNDVIPYANNPRNNDGEAVDRVASSIKEFGFNVPLVLDKENVIICGHTRYKAAKKLKLDDIPCIYAEHLTPAQIKAYRIADNKVSEYAKWNDELLAIEFEALKELDFDFNLDLTGFECDEIDNLLNVDVSADDLGEKLDEKRGTLAEKFIVPPFSILDTRQGYWQSRKNTWKTIIKSDVGRDGGLLGDELKKLAEKQGSNLTGTSIFDPVLCEVLINWFCPKGGKIIDPFAGGSVRGLVSVLLGNEYTGVDLSERQIEANIENYNAISGHKNLNGGELKKPNWINGDSCNIDTLVSDSEYDFLLTCPPYADLEVYSDDPRDISNMSYEDFRNAYTTIIHKAVDKLKDNAFMAIVVGEVRDKKGYYHNFVGDTIKACQSAGMKYYNECILIEVAGTAPLRAGKQFTAGRKVVKTHQNVLIFVKGNEKEIVSNLSDIDYDFEGEFSNDLEVA